MQWSRGNRKLRKNHKGASVCSVYASVFIFGFVFTFYCFISFFSISYLPRCHCDDDDGNNEAQQRLCQFHDSDQRFPLCFFFFFGSVCECVGVQIYSFSCMAWLVPLLQRVQLLSSHSVLPSILIIVINIIFRSEAASSLRSHTLCRYAMRQQ